MSSPSFHQFLACLRSQLRHKAEWLANESTQLGLMVTAWSAELGVTEEEAKALMLAAYFKNLGALYLDNALLAQDLPAAQHTAIKTWQLLSFRIAKNSGLTSVANILQNYSARRIPPDLMSSVFQIANCWVACTTAKGYRAEMSRHDARITLLQRAEVGWSDRALTEGFLAFVNR